MKELNDLLTDLETISLISRKKYEALIANVDTSEYEKEQPNNENGSLKTSRIQQRIKALQNLLIEKLNGLATGDYSIAYRTPVSTKFSQGVTIFQLSYKKKPIDHVKLQEALYSEVGIWGRKRFAVAHTGEADNHLRICPHIMNLESNIQDIVDAIQDFLERSAKEEVAATGAEETLVGMGWPQHPYV